MATAAKKKGMGKTEAKAAVANFHAGSTADLRNIPVESYPYLDDASFELLSDEQISSITNPRVHRAVMLRKLKLHNKKVKKSAKLLIGLAARFKAEKGKKEIVLPTKITNAQGVDVIGTTTVTKEEFNNEKKALNRAIDQTEDLLRASFVHKRAGGGRGFSRPLVVRANLVAFLRANQVEYGAVLRAPHHAPRAKTSRSRSKKQIEAARKTGDDVRAVASANLAGVQWSVLNAVLVKVGDHQESIGNVEQSNRYLIDPATLPKLLGERVSSIGTVSPLLLIYATKYLANTFKDDAKKSGHTAIVYNYGHDTRANKAFRDYFPENFITQVSAQKGKTAPPFNRMEVKQFQKIVYAMVESPIKKYTESMVAAADGTQSVVRTLNPTYQANADAVAIEGLIASMSLNGLNNTTEIQQRKAAIKATNKAVDVARAPQRAAERKARKARA